MFTWSVTTGLRISVNGQFLLQDAGAEERNYHPKSPHEPNGILIGDKDPSNGSAEDIDFKIGHLAIWDKALDSWDIQLAYKESIEKNTFSSTCCSELSGTACRYWSYYIGTIDYYNTISGSIELCRVP